ncbi:MAG: methyl-accepting chemotaxis protein [Aminivibrio sp.]|uniref:methyl-accepting chemotaxis protein n=1 Tax=Aminivibrio sp. TaxID=1872489 RepID=UPI002B20D604|nr:methyl-accepting chemotaxis protein [Aminivibrio sp.]MEA4951240.1 methyl-accepting chemotaxis protein [Aminivibrio sp.]
MLKLQFLRNVSIRVRLFALTAVLCLFTAGASFVGYQRLVAAERDMSDMYSSGVLPVQWMIDSRANMQAIRGNLNAMMLTRDETQNRALLEDIVNRRKSNDENLENYGKIELEEFEIKRLAEAKKHLMEFRKATEEVIRLAQNNQNQEAYEAFLQKAQKPMNDVMDALRDLADYCIQWSERTNENNMIEINRAERMLITLAIVSIALGVLFGFLISSSVAKTLDALRHRVEEFSEGDLTVKFDESGRDEISIVARALGQMGAKLRKAMQSISEAAERLGSNSEEFSALAEESNAGVEESRAGIDDVSSQMESLAAASQEINASVEEVASGAQSSAQKSTEMATEVEHARAAGEEGMTAVKKVVASVAGVAAESEQASKEVRKLGDRAREIQSFVSQIGGIADQTNLLALNAAIEAARAGEAGRGFAVVAEEVRKLAEESNEAAKKIAELAGMITKDLDQVVSSSEKSAKNSHASAGLAEETRETIAKMMEALSKISSSTQDLAAVSEEQAASSEEIAGAVQNIASRVSASAASSDMVRGQMKEVAESAERVAQGSEDLANLSAELRKLVGYFRFEHEGEQRGLVPAKVNTAQKRNNPSKGR